MHDETRDPLPDDRPRNGDEVATAVAAQVVAAEELARQAELERVLSEEQRKRRRVQFALAGSVLIVLTLAAFGARLTFLWRDAERARAIAVDAQQQLEGINQQLAEEKKRTEAARDEALLARAGEETAREAAEREREKLAVFEYGRTMQVAHQEWREGNSAAMRARLDGTNPKLRGWEWRYLNSISDSSLLTLKGHTGDVYSASFSADGTRIVTGSSDNTAKVWDAKSGAELLTLKGHIFSVTTASFSADGSRIVTASDTKAKVWDAKTGTELLTLNGHTKNVNSAGFRGDGSQIVTGSDDKTATVWDAQTGAELLTLKGHTSSVLSASVSADGSRIVTGSADKMAKIWNAQTGAELLTLKGHTSSVLSASFSADGTRIVMAGDGTARIWDSRPLRGSRPPAPELAAPPRAVQ